MGWDEWKHESECDFENEWLSVTCFENKGSTTLKIVTTPFSEILSYLKNMFVAKIFIK
jgi:hypothetical protein